MFNLRRFKKLVVGGLVAAIICFVGFPTAFSACKFGCKVLGEYCIAGGGGYELSGNVAADPVWAPAVAGGPQGNWIAVNWWLYDECAADCANKPCTGLTHGTLLNNGGPVMYRPTCNGLGGGGGPPFDPGT